MNGESFLNSCSQKNTWFTNKIVLRDLTSWFYCFPSIYELNPSNKMWALGTHNFFLKINFMCPSCEMVQGTVSFPTKVCEVYHVSLENESGTGIYKPLNSQDWHAHVNLKHHMTWIQCKFLIFFAQPQNWNRKEIYSDSQLLMPVAINCCPSCQRKWFHF